MKYLLMMISLVAIGFFAASCADDDSVSPSNGLSVDGQWAGSSDLLGLGDLKIDISLTEEADYIVGNGELILLTVSSQPNSIPLLVTGSFDSPNVELNFTGTGISFNGTISSDNTKMTGKLVGKDVPILDVDFDIDYEFVKQ